MEEMNPFVEEIYNSLVENIKRTDDNKEKFLEGKLNEMTPSGFDIKIKQSPKDKYSLDVTLTLPDFMPAIDKETGELWYHCTRKGVDLKYTVRDGVYYFVSDDEDLLEFISLIVEELKNEDG